MPEISIFVLININLQYSYFGSIVVYTFAKKGPLYFRSYKIFDFVVLFVSKLKDLLTSKLSRWLRDETNQNFPL